MGRRTNGGGSPGCAFSQQWSRDPSGSQFPRHESRPPARPSQRGHVPHAGDSRVWHGGDSGPPLCSLAVTAGVQMKDYALLQRMRLRTSARCLELGMSALMRATLRGVITPPAPGGSQRAHRNEPARGYLPGTRSTAGKEAWLCGSGTDLPCN